MEMESIADSKWTVIWSEDDSEWVFTTRNLMCTARFPIAFRELRGLTLRRYIALALGSLIPEARSIGSSLQWLHGACARRP